MMTQVYSGAKATILINKTIVAAAFVADYSVETRATEIEALDYVFPFEIAPERVKVNLTLRVYRTPDNDPVIDKYAPGRPVAPGIDGHYAFTQSRYISVEIKDNYDQTILYLPSCWLVRRSGSMNAGEFLVETWNITSIGYWGPDGPE